LIQGRFSISMLLEKILFLDLLAIQTRVLYTVKDNFA